MVVAFVVVVLLLLLECTIIIGMRAKINRTTDAKASHDKNTQRAVGVVESFPHEVVHETKATKLEGINSSVAAPSSSAVAAATMTMKMMTKTRQVRLWCMTLAVLSLSVATAVVGSDEDQCRLYLAESSTSTADEPKWGLYAGVDYEKGDVIQPTDLAIQTFDLMGNNRAKDEDDETYLQSIVQFFEQFIWVPDCSGGKWELEEGRCVTAIPGPGVLGGFNAKLTNTDWDHSLAYSREALGEQPGVAHPGRGASTHFFNVGLRSKDVIASGSEIFLDYGENWVSTLNLFVVVVSC